MIKMGSSNNPGSFTVKLSEPVTKVIVETAGYSSSDNSKLTVAGDGPKDILFNNDFELNKSTLEFNFDATDTITFTSVKRVLIFKLTFSSIPPVNLSEVVISNTEGKTSIEEQETLQLSAAVTDVDGALATNASILWESNNSTVATIDQNGLVTAVAPGSSTITATATRGESSVNSTFDITVVGRAPSVPTTIVLEGFEDDEAPKLELKLNQGAQTLKAIVLDQRGDEMVSEAVVWEVDNSTFISVNNGIITPQAVGTTIVKASVVSNSTKYVEIEITVVNPPQDLTVSYTFNATSGNINDAWKFTTPQNNGTNTTFQGDGHVRIYWQSNGNGNGGSTLFSPIGTGFEMVKVEITAMSTTYTTKLNVKYGTTSANTSVSNPTWTGANYTYSNNDGFSYFSIQNANTTNVQLRIQSVKITYRAV